MSSAYQSQIHRHLGSRAALCFSRKRTSEETLKKRGTYDVGLAGTFAVIPIHSHRFQLVIRQEHINDVLDPRCLALIDISNFIRSYQIPFVKFDHSFFRWCRNRMADFVQENFALVGLRLGEESWTYPQINSLVFLIVCYVSHHILFVLFHPMNLDVEIINAKKYAKLIEQATHLFVLWCGFHSVVITFSRRASEVSFSFWIPIPQG